MASTTARKNTTKRAAPANSTLILLVRHGQTPTTGRSLPGRAPGLHLSPTGQTQAEQVAQRLTALPNIAAIYASPLERTHETAAPIAKALKQKVKIEKGLLECDFGDWTGADLSKLYKLPEWSLVQRTPSVFRFPNGESFSEMQSRMTSTLDRLRNNHQGQTIVCVSHADPIKVALAHALGTHIDLFQRLVVSPCSVSAIGYSATGPIVLTINSIGGPLSELRPS